MVVVRSGQDAPEPPARNGALRGDLDASSDPRVKLDAEGRAQSVPYPQSLGEASAEAIEFLRAPESASRSISPTRSTQGPLHPRTHTGALGVRCGARER